MDARRLGAEIVDLWEKSAHYEFARRGADELTTAQVRAYLRAR